MSHSEHGQAVSVDPQGRILIPAEVRRAVGIASGDRLVLHSSEHGLVLQKREQLLKEMQDEWARAIPEKVSIVDELIAERREAAIKELEE